MNFTFGIITDYSDEGRLDDIVVSIRQLNIPKYEVLLIGPKPSLMNGVVRRIFFDETQKPNWITRKKNILCREAQYDNIVLTHDYYVFDPLWYSAYTNFNAKWDICSNQQLLLDGTRHFTDWVVWDHPILPRYTSLPYNQWDLTRYMYISGGYYLIKKSVALGYPLDESMGWGSAEDVEWSLRVRNRCKIVCNGAAIVRHNKSHRDLGRSGFPFQQGGVIQ